MAKIYLGNVHDGNNVATAVQTPEGVNTAEAFVTITDQGDGVWVNHSSEPAPRWVASDDADLAALLGQHYQVEVREFLPDVENNDFPGQEVEPI